MSVLIVKHVGVEGPGLLGDLLDRRGIQTNTVNAFENRPWPVEKPRALVVLGGPQSAYEEDKFPYLAGENRFIQDCLEARVPFLGICLGSQLLAKALGARVYANQSKEIGWGEVRLSAEGGKDPLLGLLPPRFMAFHWHGDTFDLPAGAAGLASSGPTPNQAFRFGETAWGLQFHLEVKPEDIRAWMREYSREAADIMPGNVEDQISLHYESYQAQAGRVFGEFLRVAGLA